MDWTSIIIQLIVSGSFVTVYLLGDKKTAAVLDNVSKTIDQWQELLREVRDELNVKTTEVYEVRRSNDELIARKDAKIDSLYKENSELKDERDKFSSRIAFLTAYRCNKVACIEREPPYGADITGKRRNNNGNNNG
ncbi:MAG: hypothetical protein ACI3ZT_03880 [Candidatus Cryptobacteroides sp.]